MRRLAKAAEEYVRHRDTLVPQLVERVNLLLRGAGEGWAGVELVEGKSVHGAADQRELWVEGLRRAGKPFTYRAALVTQRREGRDLRSKLAGSAEVQVGAVYDDPIRGGAALRAQTYFAGKSGVIDVGKVAERIWQAIRTTEGVHQTTQARYATHEKRQKRREEDFGDILPMPRGCAKVSLLCVSPEDQRSDYRLEIDGTVSKDTARLIVQALRLDALKRQGPTEAPAQDGMEEQDHG